MLITGIKSRPIYTTLTPDLGGRYHLLVGQGSGGDALLRLLKEMPSGADLHVLYAIESLSGTDRSEPLRAHVVARSPDRATCPTLGLQAPQETSGHTRGTVGRPCHNGGHNGGVSDLRIFATQAESVGALDGTLADCVMGTRLYIAGSESFIGSAVQVAMKYNLNADEVQREHCGSAARRVYCIHCKASNENVTTNIVACTGCGRNLLVRDHYSRRFAAYMGVMVDAEAPGELPPIKVVFG